jgi:hypothetical protein
MSEQDSSHAEIKSAEPWARLCFLSVVTGSTRDRLRNVSNSEQSDYLENTILQSALARQSTGEWTALSGRSWVSVWYLTFGPSRPPLFNIEDVGFK